MQITPLPDDCIRVCLTRDGITACTTVSSHHLVEDKRRQLEAAISREALHAFDP